MSTIKTDLYTIEVDNKLSNINRYIKSNGISKLFILVDENTKAHCLTILQEHIESSFVLLEIESGEKSKTIETCIELWNQLLDKGADRHSLLINLGGGVIGDLGGFVAASYMRGMPFIHMPTTLLAQVDASIGGKLGVNFQSLKNTLGTFKTPLAVIIHTPFLNTLTEREIKSGYAELIKHALINSKSSWEKIKTRGLKFEPLEWTKLVSNSVKVKADIVSQDPEEKGIRKILNFGHTIGHAIESYFLKTTPLLHGEAVAKGMIVEAYISFTMGRINVIELDEINNLLESLYMPPQIAEDEVSELLNLMTKDKKNKAGQKLFSLLKGIGACDYDVEVSDELITEALLF